MGTAPFRTAENEPVPISPPAALPPINKPIWPDRTIPQTASQSPDLSLALSPVALDQTAELGRYYEESLK
jgi:hypothetical protein